MNTPAENINEFQDESYRFELTVNENSKVLVFYNKPLKEQISWLEFDLGTNRLDFVTDEGQMKNFGMPVRSDLAKYMHNAHQVLMVLTDEVTGEALDGEYFPLILHREY